MLWEIIVEIRDILESTHRISEMVNQKGKVEVYRSESNINESKNINKNSNPILDDMNDDMGNIEPFSNLNIPNPKLEFKLKDQKCMCIDSDYLFPGDIVKITSNGIIPADIVMIEGKCVVSEAMLTGESIPLIKDAIHPDSYVSLNKNILYYGSRILFAESKKNNFALGIVINTNYLTIRGGLVRSILYPPDLFTDFQRDSYLVVFCMFILAIIGFILTIPSLIAMDISTWELVDKCLDLITVAVPPALPLALSFGMTQSIHRIRHSAMKIYCTRPQKIVEAGLVDTIVFDKTGTLTEDKMVCHSVVKWDWFKAAKRDYVQQSELYDLKEEYDFKVPFYRGMAVCNSIVLLNDMVYGDPLEIELLRKTDFMIVDENYEDGICQCKFTRKDLNFKMKSKQRSEMNYNNLDIKNNGDINSVNERSDNISMNSNNNKNVSNTNEYQNNYDVFIDKCVNKYQLRKNEELLVKSPHYKSHNFKLNSRKSSKSCEVERNLIYRNTNKMSLRDVNSIDIVKRFDFDSALARMSVIVSDQQSTSGWRIYCKGSPEKLYDICIKDSLPEDYILMVNSYAKQGLRVISFAFKDIKIRKKKVLSDLNEIGRNLAESDLVFCGFVVMKNPLKIQTGRSITMLNNANIQCYMATGDHLLTAISVSRECYILSSESVVGVIKFKKIKNFKIEHLKENNKSNDYNLKDNVKINLKVLNNKKQIDDFKINYDYEYTLNDYIYIDYENKTESYDELVMKCKFNKNISKSSVDKFYAIEGLDFIKFIDLYEHKLIDLAVFKHIFSSLKVYARMKPEHKSKLVNSIRTISDSVVGMCGDGANDCAALKEANVGLALSEAEASIASPFTSCTFDISSYVYLLREGRCALVTSFQCFKWIMMYSLIQFSTVSLLYTQHTNLTDNQFLYIDLVIIIPLVYFMSWSLPADTLSIDKPQRKLFSVKVIGSIMLQALIQLLFQIYALKILKNDPYYKPIDTIMQKRHHKYNNKNLSDEDWENLRSVSFESSALFLVSVYQYILTNIIYSKGFPFKESIFNNKYLIGWICTISLMNIFILTYDVKVIYEDFYQMLDLGWLCRLEIGTMILINYFVTFIGEYVLDYAIKRII